MDPNANLDEIRRIVTNGSRESGQPDYERLVDLIEALDEWLSRGGFLPSAWAWIREGRAASGT